MFKHKFLVTGCGSLGRELILQLLDMGASVACLDHSEQSFFKFESDHGKPKSLRFIVADIADYDAVNRACHDMNYVVHTIAKKFVNYVEDSPIEAIKTNILGTVNIINACSSNQVTKVINVSTDKVCHAVSTYGLTKALTERLISWANKSYLPTIFSTIRHPNFLLSDGSCFSVWDKQRANNEPITITEKRMTRYFISLTEAASLTLKALEVATGGEIFVPATAKKYKIRQLAEAYKQKEEEFKVIGRRLGERLNEVLMTPSEAKKAKRVCDNLLWRFIP